MMVDNSLLKTNIENLGKDVIHPDGTRNFTQVNENRVNYLANLGEEALPHVAQYINAPKSFDGLLEALFVVDKMADNKVKGVENLYPVLSKYNNSECPEIQTMLSGIYRKTLVPDAFGPLCRMLNKQVCTPQKGLFDPSEETGGAILEYLRSYGALNHPLNCNMLSPCLPVNNIPQADKQNVNVYYQNPTTLNYQAVQYKVRNGLKI